MTVEFMEMQDGHLNEVAEIYNAYVRTSTATFDLRPLSVNDVKRLVYFADSRFKSHIIVRNERVCGYCVLLPFHKKEAYGETAELSLYLRPGDTNQGIGGTAFDFLESFAVRRGFHTLICCICTENEASIRLCEKKGYVKCGHFVQVGRKFGRLLDVVYYQKVIGQSGIGSIQH